MSIDDASSHGDAPRDAVIVDRHTALLSSRAGRGFVAAVVAVMSVWTIGPNLPASPARDVIDSLWAPAIDAGFEQNWALFSPNPRDQSIEVFAVLDYADGTQAIWTVPEFDPIIGAYRTYRWRKWQEQVRLDANSRYWESSAAWIAEQNRRNGELATAVHLIRRWYDHDALTADGTTDSGPNEHEFHIWTPES